MTDYLFSEITGRLTPDQKDLANSNLSAGFISTPVFTDLNNGQCIIDAASCLLYDNDSNLGNLKEYLIADATFTLTEGITSYIIVNYNAGSPAYQVTTNVEIINESDIIPVFTCYNEGDVLIHKIDWDLLGTGVSNKLNMRFVKTQRFGHESGLAIGEDGTNRYVTISSGVVWTGAARHSLQAFDSNLHRWLFWEYNGATWSKTVTTSGGVYNNTQYQGPTGLVALQPNQFGVIWVFRDADNEPHAGYILGNDSYGTVAAAATAPLPSLIPGEFAAHGILIGRIIVERDSNVAAQIDSSFENPITNTPVTVHNNLSGIQGGTTSEFYHLSQSELSAITAHYDSTSEHGLDAADYYSHTSNTSLHLGTDEGVVYSGSGTPVNTKVPATLMNQSGNITGEFTTQSNYTYRVGINPAYINDGIQEFVRITLYMGTTAVGDTLTSMYLGKNGNTFDPNNMTAMLPLTFNGGSTSLTVAAGGIYTSDWIDFTSVGNYNGATEALWFSFHETPASGNTYKQSVPGGLNTYRNGTTGDVAGSTSGTSFATATGGSNALSFVFKVETFTWSGVGLTAGKINDFYVDLDTGEYYRKSALPDVWQNETIGHVVQSDIDASITTHNDSTVAHGFDLSTFITQADNTHLINAATFTPSNSEASYPTGISIGRVTSGNSWPASGEGTLITHKYSTDWMSQYFQPFGASDVYWRRWDKTPLASYDDNFTGNDLDPIDSNKWDVGTSVVGGEAWIVSNRARLLGDRQRMTGKYYFTGDFDVEIQFDVVSSVDGKMDFAICDVTRKDDETGLGGSNEYAYFYESGSLRRYTDGNNVNLGHTQVSRYLRFTRVGTQISMYSKVNVGDSWTQDFTATQNGTIGQNLYIRARCGTGVPAGAAFFDNYVINSGVLTEDPATGRWATWVTPTSAHETTYNHANFLTESLTRNRVVYLDTTSTSEYATGIAFDNINDVDVIINGISLIAGVEFDNSGTNPGTAITLAAATNAGDDVVIIVWKVQ